MVRRYGTGEVQAVNKKKICDNKITAAALLTFIKHKQCRLNEESTSKTDSHSPTS
jgi:hypothetical protein